MPFQRGDDSGQKAPGPAGRNPDELFRQGNGGAGPACGLPEFDEKTIAKNTDESTLRCALMRKNTSKSSRRWRNR